SGLDPELLGQRMRGPVGKLLWRRGFPDADDDARRARAQRVDVRNVVADDRDQSSREELEIARHPRRYFHRRPRLLALRRAAEARTFAEPPHGRKDPVLLVRVADLLVERVPAIGVG